MASLWFGLVCHQDAWCLWTHMLRIFCVVGVVGVLVMVLTIVVFPSGNTA